MMISETKERENRENSKYIKNIRNKKRNKSIDIASLTDVEKLFKRTANINMQIETKKEEISYWREFASSAQAVFSQVNTNTGGRSNKKSKIEESVCRIMDIEESLGTDIAELIALKSKAMSIIDKIDVPEYKSLLIHRYICGKTWYEVADTMGYSYVHTVNRLHPKALARIREMGIGNGNGDED